MKFNIFVTLTVILINTLCIFSTPVNLNDNDDSLNTSTANNLNKRYASDVIQGLFEHMISDTLKCLIDGSRYSGYWQCCNFSCLKEPSQACRNICQEKKGQAAVCNSCIINY